MADNWHERPGSGKMKPESEAIIVKGMLMPNLARRDAN
jgi:hypothetical protein